MSTNVPGAAPPGPTDSVFGGGWLGVLLGGGKEILSSVQQHELAKMNAKAMASSLAAPANYQTVPVQQPGVMNGYLTNGPLGGLSYEVILAIAGAGLLAIYLLRR